MLILGGQMKEAIMSQILEISKHGATETKLVDNLPLTSRRLRRIVAELVDRGFLQFIGSQEAYITTHRGYIFLDKLKKEKCQIHKENNKATTIRKLKNHGVVNRLSTSSNS